MINLIITKAVFAIVNSIIVKTSLNHLKVSFVIFLIVLSDFTTVKFLSNLNNSSDLNDVSNLRDILTLHIGLSPSGKATDFDSVTRGFESRRPSQPSASTRRSRIGALFF